LTIFSTCIDLDTSGRTQERQMGQKMLTQTEI